MDLASLTKRVLPGLLTLAISVPAGAAAIFDAHAFATLTISSSAPGISAEGDAFVFTHGSETFGPGATAMDTPTALIVGSNPLGVGDGISQSGIVTGHAGPEEARAFINTDGVIILENLSSEELLIELLLDYSLFASVAVDHFDEDAAAEASVVVFSENFEIDFQAAVFADALFGPPLDSTSGTPLFSLLLGPGQTQSVFMLVDTAGFAYSLHEAQTPEPSTLGLMAIGVLAVARGRRRRQRP